MPECDESSTFFSRLPKEGNLGITVPYVINLPRSVPVPVRTHLHDLIRKTIQDAVDKMDPEEFEFSNKKD